jgi:hypothetical protein
MAYTDKPIAAVRAEVESRSRSRAGRSSYRHCTDTEPSLGCWPDAHVLAAEVARRAPTDQDRVLAILLPLVEEDQLAQLTVLAVLSRALGSIVSEWAAGGVAGADLLEMEAELVAGCWEATLTLARRHRAGSPLPPRPGLWLTDRARDSVRVPRRRQGRAARRHVPLEELADVAVGMERPTAQALAGEIHRAIRSGRLTGREASPVFLTRVAGLAVSEAAAWLGCSDAVLRTKRARAEKRLIVGVAA